MNNDLYPKLDFKGFDFSQSPIFDVINDIEDSMNDHIRRGEEAYENRQRLINASERTAENTRVANEQSQEQINLMKRQIELLEENNALKGQLLDQANEQLSILKNIFSSNEDSVIVEKEIWKLLAQEIDDKHPLWDFVKDKGGDILVTLATATDGTPLILKVVKAVLIAAGIKF